MNKSENEIWKPYSEFWFLEDSSWGRVRTLDRMVPTSRGNGKRLVRGRILKQCYNKGGYLYVSFSVNGKVVNRSVHRLIAQTFIPNPDNLPEVNHLDNNPSNNNVSNLEWCTPEYNIEYREKYGVACNRPVYAVNLETLEVLRFESQHGASRELKSSQGNINMVLKGQRNQAGGFWFTKANENAVENTRTKFGDEVARKVEQLMSEKDYN